MSETLTLVAILVIVLALVCGFLLGQSHEREKAKRHD